MRVICFVQANTTHLQHFQYRVEAIQIPVPTNIYRAVRRSRFAFDRITPAQARTNTAEHERHLMRTTIEATELHPSEPAQQEQEEANIFLDEDNPNINDCA